MRELRLLELFVAHEGRVLSREAILDAVWGIKYGGTTRTLDQHIAKLRQKVEQDPAHPRHTAGCRFQTMKKQSPNRKEEKPMKPTLDLIE